jgi:MFS family permease
MVFRDGIASRLMDTLTGGAFLAGLGLLTGASNLELGLLAALPFLAQVAQVPTLALLLRLQDRRRIVVVTCALARFILLAIALLLLWAPERLTPDVLLGLLALSALLAVTATAAWNWWMRDLLPPATLGRFFGRRLRGTTVVALGALLAAGWVLDQFEGRGRASDGYALLFGVAALAGFVGLNYLARTPHTMPPPSPPAARSLATLGRVLREAPARRLAVALGALATAVTFALPFAAVFMLRALGMSYFVITALAALSQLAYIAGLRGWAHLSDNHGNRAVLLLSVGLLAAVQLGWAAAGWSAGWTMAAWLALLHFLGGYATGGIDLGGTNLLLRSVPQQGAPAHLAAISLSRALVAGIGTVLAGWLWDSVGSGELWAVGAWALRGFQLLSLIGVALSLLALVGLARVPEPVARPVLDVARAMRREVHQMSSIAGIRGLIHAVSYSVEFMAAPFEARRLRRGALRQPAPAPAVGEGAPRPPPG